MNQGSTTYRIDLEYEGTRFHGWQEQRGVRTVAGALRETLTGQGLPIQELTGAGRTDRGVHALQQTAHLRTSRPLAELDALRRALNDELPADLHLLALREVPATFHARHSARARSYLYQIALRRSSFARRHSWWVKSPLDLAAMQGAAVLLPGRHDFELFAEIDQRRPASTLVHLEAAELVELDGALVVRLVASHFLWKMVRRIVGGLVQLGQGQISEAQWRSLIAARATATLRAEVAGWTAPSAGLFLERVLYDEGEQLGPVAAPIPIRPES